MSDEASENTDRELWREREGDYYADSIHVTTQGGIGINCGGTVYVMRLRDWHALKARLVAVDRLLRSGRRLYIVDTSVLGTEWRRQVDELIGPIDAARATDSADVAAYLAPCPKCGQRMSSGTHKAGTCDGTAETVDVAK